MTAAGLSFYWWQQPERQVRRAQRRFVAAIEKSDFTAMSGLLAEDYRDQWGHDKAIVVRNCREVFSQFLTLSIERVEHGLERGDGGWILRETITIKGFGGALAMAARDEVNALREPFTMVWRSSGSKPWDWELVAVRQPELKLPQ